MNHWAFITGATGGLGKAFAVECASRGGNVFLTDLHAEALETLAGGLRRAYRVQTRIQPCDLTEPASRISLFDAARASHLHFEALINVAGTDHEGAFTERSGQEIRSIIRLNIEGTLDVTHAILPLRNPVAPFRIINVASLAAFYPMPVKATYAASKRFLLDFSLALHEELREMGVTVTALCPGGLPTNPDVIEAIAAQGWLGELTTQNIGAVAADTLDAAAKGRTVYVPGWFNRLLQWLGSLAPASANAALIGARWRSAHQQRELAQWEEALG